MKKPRIHDIKKATYAARILNALELLALLTLLALTFTGALDASFTTMRPLAALVCLLLMVDNVVNLNLSGKWIRSEEQYEMLKEALGHLERLNTELRTQKHDFMNHLQVVYSLVEMGEPREATDYIEKVHGDMQSKSLAMRTAKPAVNALLQAKLADCEKQGIAATLRITSSWRLLPLEEWEMCRVLGNLIDNAMDALRQVAQKRLDIELYEDIFGYGFRISNNGPMIGRNLLDKIWARGFSTKGEGRGLGLHIVKTLVEEAGGSVVISSTADRTEFSGHLPISMEKNLTEA